MEQSVTERLVDCDVTEQIIEEVPPLDKNGFNQKLYKLAMKRELNTKLIPQERYVRFIEEIKQINANGKKTSLQFRRDKKYAIIKMHNGEERLFYKPALVKNERLIMVTIEETYDIIHKCHLKLNHAGRSRMKAELKKKYYNVTTEGICLYLSMCQGCRNKMVKKTKVKRVAQNTVAENDTSQQEHFAIDADDDNDSLNDFVSEDPLESSVVTFGNESDKMLNDSDQTYPELYSRAQIDLLSVTNEPTEEYKYLMVYRNCATKFIHLKALKGISVDEAAEALLDIFLVFGTPNILQSKNGVAILKPICRRVHAQCPDVKVVYSENVLPISAFRGKSNEDILRKLNDWLVKTQNTKWQNGVKYIQHSLNTTFHKILCRTPSELVFGYNPSKGLNSFMSRAVFQDVFTEDDLLTVLEAKKEPNVLRSNAIQLSESLVMSGSIKIEVDRISEDESVDAKFI